MNKLLVFALVVVLAVFVAGLYGVVHNQVSYTVAPEYFTKYGLLAILVAWAFHVVIKVRTKEAP